MSNDVYYFVNIYSVNIVGFMFKSSTEVENEAYLKII